MRLCLDTLKSGKAMKPGYPPADLGIGIVHFGPGAFHRAHQAAYFDTLARTDRRWGVCGVSLHSKGVRAALGPQDGLYTLVILDTRISYRVIGAMREHLVAPDDAEAVFDRLLRPSVEIVTSTVTEKGYCLDADFSLDLHHPDITHDLANPGTPRSFIGYIVEALRRRKAAGLAPFVLIPCDNLLNNGGRLKTALAAFAMRSDRDLERWIRTELQCPSTMVDSITPATDDDLRARVEDATGLSDAWPIQREAFTQWVIEAHDHEGGPDWESVGVTLTDDVTAFENAKLRLLNGAHSSLAYLGLIRGYDTVAEAMKDAELAGLVKRLMIEDVAPLLTAPEGLDLALYCDDILNRFRNPSIAHNLSQIAWDGSVKLPIRILSSLREALSLRRDISRLCLAVAGWMYFVRLRVTSGNLLRDPIASELEAVARKCCGDNTDVSKFLILRAVFPEDLANNAQFVEALEIAYASLPASPSVRLAKRL